MTLWKCLYNGILCVASYLGRVEVRPTSNESENENKKDRDNFEKAGKRIASMGVYR